MFRPRSRRFAHSFRLPGIVMLCLPISLLAASVRAQESNTQTSSQRLARARAAAMAARIDLGLIKPEPPRVDPARAAILRAEVEALKEQNRLLRIALARSEVQRTVRPPSVPVYREPRSEPATLAPLDSYTGLVIDARDLPGFQRSPAPRIYGPGLEVLYPDARHVPTPDEVQEASVIRYYHTEDEARHGFVGSNPLVLRAVAAYGPGNDCVRVSAADMALLRALDARIGFSQNWKVGVLVSAEQ